MQLNAGKTRIHDDASAPGEACNNRLDIVFCHGVRLPKLTTGQFQLDRGRRLGVRIHNLLALSPSMTDLRPEMVSSARTSSRPGLQ